MYKSKRIYDAFEPVTLGSPPDYVPPTPGDDDNNGTALSGPAEPGKASPSRFAVFVVIADSDASLGGQQAAQLMSQPEIRLWSALGLHDSCKAFLWMLASHSLDEAELRPQLCPDWTERGQRATQQLHQQVFEAVGHELTWTAAALHKAQAVANAAHAIMTLGAPGDTPPPPPTAGTKMLLTGPAHGQRMNGGVPHLGRLGSGEAWGPDGSELGGSTQAAFVFDVQELEQHVYDLVTTLRGVVVAAPPLAQRLASPPLVTAAASLIVEGSLRVRCAMLRLLRALLVTMDAASADSAAHMAMNAVQVELPSCLAPDASHDAHAGDVMVGLLLTLVVPELAHAEPQLAQRAFGALARGTHGRLLPGTGHAAVVVSVEAAGLLRALAAHSAQWRDCITARIRRALVALPSLAKTALR